MEYTKLKAKAFKTIIERRKELGIKQKDLASMVGVSEKTLIANLKDRQEMGVDTYFKLCAKLKLTPELTPLKLELDKLNIQRVSHCACTPDETTGTTTVRCCNTCGKPAESFWS